MGKDAFGLYVSAPERTDRIRVERTEEMRKHCDGSVW